MSAVEEEVLQLLSSLNVAAMPREWLEAGNDQEEPLVDLDDIFDEFLNLIDSKRVPLIDILKIIFKGFVPILTLKLGSSHDKASTEIMQVKNRCLDFIVQLSSLPDYRSTTKDLIYILIQHVCAKTPQKAIFHSKNIPTILQLHDLMPDANLRTKFYTWLVRFSRHAKVNYRLFAVEIALSLLSKQNSCDIPNDSRHILFQIILKRCSDVTSGVVIKALGGLRNLLSEDDQYYSQLIKDFDSNLNFETSIHTQTPRQSKSETKRNSVARSSLAVIPLTPSTEDVSLKNSATKREDAAQEAENGSSEDENEKDSDIHSSKFSDMIIRRCADEKVFVRRTALQVLQLISKAIADQVVCENILNILREACIDSTLIVRKQGIDTLTSLLQNQQLADQQLESTYLNCVFPCLADRESSVVDKTIESICSTIFDRLLQRRFVHTDLDYMKCWRLLHSIEKNRPLIRYFARFMQKYSIANQSSLAKVVKNTVEMISDFHVTTENPEFQPYVNAAWMILAETSKFVHLSPSFALDIWLSGKLVDFCSRNDPNNQILNYVCKLLLNRRSQMLKEETKPLVALLTEELVNYRVEPENIASVLNLIKNLDEDDELFRQLYQCCKDFLSNLVYKSEIVVNNAVEEEIIRRLITLGELSLLQPLVIDKQLVFIVQVIIAANGQNNTSHWTTPGSQSDENLTKRSLITLNERIRAVAVTTLGKLCLQDEDSAKRCVAALAFELSNNSNNDDHGKCNNLLQNNVIVVLSDMCIRYTSLVDRHVEALAECLRNRSPLVRKQTSTLLTNLLKEDYLKWRGLLFYRFLTSLLDCNIDVRNYIEYCLVDVLLERSPLMFFNHFLDSIFVLNDAKHAARSSSGLTALLLKSGKSGDVSLALSGIDNRDKRNYLYSFMLQYFTDQQRFQVTTRICQEILGILVDENAAHEISDEILYDCLNILSCKNIKLNSLNKQVSESAVADDEEPVGGNASAIAAVAELTKTALRKAVKQAIIDLIIPVLVSLKHQLEAKRSPMLKYLLAYFLELTKDYKSELITHTQMQIKKQGSSFSDEMVVVGISLATRKIDEIFAVDQQLATEIGYDLKRFERSDKLSMTLAIQ